MYHRHRGHHPKWHRKLIAHKYGGSARRGPGRPRAMQQIRDLIVCMARENPTLGCRRIRGSLLDLERRVSRSTIRRVLKAHGIEPDPQGGKRTPRSTFLRSPWGAIAAADLFTVEVWTVKGLIRCHGFFVIDLESRTVGIAGITAVPTGAWMCQIARQLTDGFAGFLSGHRYLIHDRDPPFTKAFREVLQSSGVISVRLPPRSPALNTDTERLVRSIREECLSKIIPLGERHLRSVIDEYMKHYHAERPHQGLGNRLIVGRDSSTRHDQSAEVVCHERLGGLLKHYRYRERKAA